ncbi:hypothetical protein B0H14DRAFT_3422856 [Mycena olivaceomarginata]|nr:hypothetical protein B0H14DRAFT_3422856 [Mycena olivaceomarginata]
MTMVSLPLMHHRCYFPVLCPWTAQTPASTLYGHPSAMGRRGLLMRMLGMSETREPGAGTGEPRSNVIVLILVLILVVRVWEEAQVATILLVGVPICPETGDDVGIEEFLDIRDTGEDSAAGAEKTARSGDGVGRAEVGIVVKSG